MLRTILATALATALLVPAAHAAEREGTFALGFSTADAPVAVRYFTSDKLAIDAGLGFESGDVVVTRNANRVTETATSFFLEGGVSYVLFDHGDSFFFVRPALAYASLDDRVYGTGGADASWTRFDVEANLGAEVRLSANFGLTFQHGLRYRTTSVPDAVRNAVGTDSISELRTLGENVTEAGVWFTF